MTVLTVIQLKYLCDHALSLEVGFSHELLPIRTPEETSIFLCAEDKMANGEYK